MSNVYEERATMIAAGDLQEFVPFGRDHCKHHPNALNLQLRQLQPASELWSSDGAAGLVGSLQEVTIHEKQKESWQLRKGVSEIGEEVDYDEELYVAGNMVIWSKGSKSQALAVYKAFTVDSPVQQALWCDFIISQDKSEKTYSSDEVEKCICILQSSCINMHSIEGKDYIASLPFQVANVWPTKYGLLFERSSFSHEVPPGPPREPLPTMFSMLHPLDEITPLVCKSGSLFGSSRVQYVVDHAMKIVFLSTDPSIVMTYDTVHGLHSVWTLRRVKTEEENVVLKFSEQGGTPQHVATSSSLTAHLRSLSKGDSPVASPFQNYSSIHCWQQGDWGCGEREISVGQQQTRKMKNCFFSLLTPQHKLGFKLLGDTRESPKIYFKCKRRSSHCARQVKHPELSLQQLGSLLRCPFSSNPRQWVKDQLWHRFHLWPGTSICFGCGFS